MNISIFTEAYGCGEVLKDCLTSFYKYHDYKVHIYGTQADFDELGEIKNHPNNIFVDLGDDHNIKNVYNEGHWKTAYIFAKHIKNNNEQSYIIHFDSDIIFFDDCITPVQEQFEDGFDLVGPRRCYKYNRNNIDNIRHQQDVVQTYFFGVNNNELLNLEFSQLVSMCRGVKSVTSDIPLDFFDPVSYYILHNNKKVFFLDDIDYGGLNEFGGKNKYLGEKGEQVDMDIGKKIAHFAGVGSGCFNAKINNTSDDYSEWSVKRYEVYKKINKDVSPKEIKQLLNVQETSHGIWP